MEEKTYRMDSHLHPIHHSCRSQLLLHIRVMLFSPSRFYSRGNPGGPAENSPDNYAGEIPPPKALLVGFYLVYYKILSWHFILKPQY